MSENINLSFTPENIPNLGSETLELNNIIAQGLVEGGKINNQSRVMVVWDKTGDDQTDAEIADAKSKVIEFCRSRGATEITEYIQDWRQQASDLAKCTDPLKAGDILKEQEEKIVGSTAILILDTGQNFAQILKEANIRKDILDAYYQRRKDTRLPINEGKTRWTLTRYPTEEQAKKEGISKTELDKWVEFAFRQDWSEITKAQAELVKVLNKTEELNITANLKDPNKKRRTRLFLKLAKGGEQMTFVNDTPLTVGANVPGAEVFSSPIINSAFGQVYLGKCSFRGKDMKNVYLKFKAGQVIEASSDDPDSDAFIKEIISIDKGSKYIGEIAFGGNPGLSRMLLSGLMLSDPFWSEKIGGTIHFALGYSMEDNELGWKDQNVHVFNKNESLVHMDGVIGDGQVIASWRENGQRRKKVILKKGKYIDPKLAALNSKAA